MTDGEKRQDESEDLFEDLDQFFAPIQNVDWPQTEPSAPQEGEPATPEREVEAQEEEVSFEREEVFEAEEEGEQETAWEAKSGDAAEPSAESLPEAPAVVRIEEEGAWEPEPEPEMGVLAETGEIPAETEAAVEHFAGSVRADEPAEPERDILEQIDEESEGRTVTITTAEGMQGPSWQEPTHEEVGLEEPGAGASRNVPAAFVTGIAMGAIAILLLAISKEAFAIAAGLLVLAAQAEFYAAVRRRHHNPATLIGLVFGALTLVAGFRDGPAAMLSMVVLALIFTFLWEMATPAKFRRNVMVNVGITMLGVVYVPLMAAFGLTILAAEPSGQVLVFAVLGLTFLYDTVAFVIGSLWGDTQMAPHISPKKSWQGAIIASLAVVIVSLAAVPNIDGMGWQGAAALAVAVVVMAPLGDLAESLLKRDLGIKDMGSILPGHGGILDRIDSVLLVAPVAFLTLLAVVPAAG